MKNIFLILFAFSFFSCGFNEPVREYFEFYTDSAAIEKNSSVGAVPINNQGLECLSPESDKTITCYLRNPQSYTLNFGYIFDSKKVSDFYQQHKDGVVFLQDTPTTVQVTFKKDFLYDIDFGKASLDKNLSGYITVEEDASKRKFDNYRINKSADSVPLNIISPMFQTSGANLTGEYILCFYLPIIDNTVHQNDLKKLQIGNKTYYIYNQTDSKGIAKIYEDSSFSRLSSDFYDTEPTVYSLSDKFPTFKGTSDFPENAYQAVYYKTGITPTPNEVKYEIVLEDNAGLKSKRIISNLLKKLEPPKFFSSGTVYADASGVYKLGISHDGFAITESSREYCGNVQINYTIKETSGKTLYDGTDTYSAFAETMAVVSLPVGIYFITATASKDSYLDSDTAVLTNFVVLPKSNSSGSDSTSGSGTGEIINNTFKITATETESNGKKGFILKALKGSEDITSSCTFTYILKYRNEAVGETITMSGNAYCEINNNQILLKNVLAGQYIVIAQAKYTDSGNDIYFANNFNITIPPTTPAP